MAMSLAVIGLRVPGIVIKDPGCVAKTYPGFFEDLEKLRC
jgi:3-phosphoshikimate 1-carboxyvinyltransferase